jgi:hypothetical protein
MDALTGDATSHSTKLVYKAVAHRAVHKLSKKRAALTTVDSSWLPSHVSCACICQSGAHMVMASMY